MITVNVAVKIVPELVHEENGTHLKEFEAKKKQILEFTVYYFVPVVYILFTIAYFIIYNYL